MMDDARPWGNHEAHDYAERIRARLPRRLQELREGCGMSMYALWLKCGVSRDMISRIEGGEFRIVSEYSAAKGSGASKKYFCKNSLAAYRWIER